MKCTHSSRYARIAIWGQARDHHPGDDVVVSALIREVRARQPDAEIVVLSRASRAASRDLDETRLRHVTSSLTPPLGPWRAFRLLQSCDLLIVAGAGPFGDSLPELCKWISLARLAGTQVHMLSVGTGDLSPSISRFLVRQALSAASYVSFRDPHSEALAREVGVQRSCPVVPDLAFSLDRQVLRRDPTSPLVVGVNPDDVLTKARGFEACVEKHVGFLSWLLAERYEVRLFHSSAEELRICKRLEERLAEEGLLREGQTLLHAEALRPEHVLESMMGCDFVVAGAFHCILIPALSGIPVVGLAHSSPARDLLERLGQEGYAADIDRFGTPHLVDSFCSLRADAARARDLLKLRIPECREAVRLQYDDLYGPVVQA